MKPKVFFLEVIIVVIGVSLAFFAENKRQKYLNKKTENYYAKGLILDLEHNLEDIKFHYKEDSIAYIKLKTIRNDVLSDSFTLDSLLNVIIHFWGSRAITFHQSTYQEMVSRGDISLIQNDSLRPMIIDYFSYYDGVQYVENHNSNMVTGLGIPYIISNIDLINLSNLNSTYNQSAVSKPEFYNMVIFFMGFISDRRNIYNVFHEKNRQLLYALKEHYN
tara:strand:- start:169 stop:825 length:657 start_codon:yes stop_codon:yes gene_type:complete